MDDAQFPMLSDSDDKWRADRWRSISDRNRTIMARLFAGVLPKDVAVEVGLSRQRVEQLAHRFRVVRLHRVTVHLRACVCGLHIQPGRASEHRRSPGHFWRMVDRSGECWEWAGIRNPGNGYGQTGQESAHRRAWQLAYGPIPDGLWVLHHCDNPPCVRPDHLFVGTPSDNTQDMLAKGRGRHQQPDFVPTRWAQPPREFCLQGHAMTPENTNHYRDGGQRCRTCIRVRKREYKRRQRALKAA